MLVKFAPLSQPYSVQLENRHIFLNIDVLRGIFDAIGYSRRHPALAFVECLLSIFSGLRTGEQIALPVVAAEVLE